MATILLNDAISPDSTEKKLQELLNEFLKSYFTGVEHSSLDGPRTFPEVNLEFNQSAPAQPGGDTALIHCIFSDLKPVEEWISPTLKRVNVAATLTFYIRTSAGGEKGNKQDFLCRSVADALRQLFQCSTYRQALAQKGIHHPKIKRGPVPLSSTGYATRMITLTTNLSYDTARFSQT